MHPDKCGTVFQYMLYMLVRPVASKLLCDCYMGICKLLNLQFLQSCFCKVAALCR